MTGLEVSNYHEAVESGDLVGSFDTFKTLYNLADNALADIATQVDSDGKMLDMENNFLRDKELLIDLAAKSRCKNIHDISQKIDFLYRVHIDEKSQSDLTPMDILVKSIWQDCQSYL